MTKQNHGGKRDGAGRPARKIKREALTMRVEPETAQEFRSVCKRYTRSQSEQLTEWVRQSRDNKQTK